MYRSLKDIYVNESFARPVPPPYMRYVPVNLLSEGGAGGHMTHPYEMQGVNTGRDLINVFEEAVKAIQSERPAVKIDGSNVSIKIARNLDGSIHLNSEGQMEFGVERGTKNNEDDIKGVTVDRLGSRFVNKKDPTQKHGLIEAGSIILNIFNTALPSIENDLKKLKFFGKEKQHFFNMEYVYGQTNVVGYNKNFLAIHGVNEIDLATRKAREVNYNRNVLEDVIKKVRPIAKQAGFDVYSSIPAELEEGIEEVDFSPALNSELTVLYTPDHAVTKRLAVWLNEAHSPAGKIITLADNKKISPFSKKNYDIVVGRVPLNSAIRDSNDAIIKQAVDGAVFVQATILMGQILKNALRSEIGHVGAHEGIVVRNLMYKGKPVGIPIKFTGDFIIGKEQGKFAQQDNEEEMAEPTIGSQQNNYLGQQTPSGQQSLNGYQIKNGAFAMSPDAPSLNVGAGG